MREIKFRAWDGVMHEDISMQVDYTYNGIKPQIAVELMQYTGLKDKNGVEIYEGDIVTWHNKYFEYHNPRREFKGQIKYDTAHFAIFTLDGNWDNSDWIGAITEVEVIGNIYENPELLNV